MSIVVAVAAALLAGCGDDDAESSGGGSPRQRAPASSEGAIGLREGERHALDVRVGERPDSPLP